MSSSNSAAARAFTVVTRNEAGAPVGNPALTRARVLRGITFARGVSPLDAELAGPVADVDPAVAAAEERRGYEAGYEAGVAEGRAAGRAVAATETAVAVARLETLASALAAAADDLRRRQALELTGLEDTLARAAVDLASAVVGRELQVSVSPGTDALARALALVPAGTPAVARLHPADAAIITAAPAADASTVDATTGAQAGGGQAGGGQAGGGQAGGGQGFGISAAAAAAITIIPDPAIEPGGCILEVGESRIDAQLGPALDRVRAALLGDR